MAYVYDYPSLTQYVYVNGVLDVSGSPKGPYQGTTGDLTIGTNGVNYPNNYWDGCIDSVAYFALAKNVTQVLFDATMSGMYTFDNTLLDSGPLLINATDSSYSYTASGRVNQAILISASAYVQASGFVLLGTVGQSYSMSIWIKPIITTSGSIVHVSSGSTGTGWCISVLGFTSTGRIGAQSWLNSPWSSVYIVGPTVTAAGWTHVATTYSQTNGFKLWINGAYYGSYSGGAYNYGAAGTPVYVMVGSCLSGSACSPGGFSPYISNGQYYGYVDEFYIYSRELSSSDVYSLANP